MEESVTYQRIIRKGFDKGIEEGIGEGKLREARAVLLRLGQKRFGQADPATVASLEALTDLEQLEQLTERLLDVSSWQALLA